MICVPIGPKPCQIDTTTSQLHRVRFERLRDSIKFHRDPQKVRKYLGALNVSSQSQESDAWRCSNQTTSVRTKLIDLDSESAKA
jgi:hypothetical protein